MHRLYFKNTSLLYNALCIPYLSIYQDNYFVVLAVGLLLKFMNKNINHLRRVLVDFDKS